MGRKSAPDPADGSDCCTGCLYSALFDHGSVCAEQRWRFLECEGLDAGRLSKSFSGSEYIIWRGFRNSFFYSIAFTIISVTVTLLTAYPMSRNDFMGKKFFNAIFVFTMFFGGGLMPTYLLMDQLGLVNTVWAILLPGALNVWNMILARSYYKTVPIELYEAASMDGSTEVQYFFKILIPVCKPIIAVLCLYQFVAMWNSYFDAMIYLDDQNLQPLQLVLRSILVQNQINPNLVANMEKLAETAKLADLLKYSTIVISSVPLIVLYPFFAKSFEKGVMIGSVKG